MMRNENRHREKEIENEMSHDEEHKMHNLWGFITFIGFLLFLPPSNWPHDENVARCFQYEYEYFYQKIRMTRIILTVAVSFYWFLIAHGMSQLVRLTNKSIRK